MTTNADWTMVAERLEALALKLKLHLKQTGAAEEAPKAFGDLRHAVEDAFAAASNAVDDQAVKADVRDVGRLLAEAVSRTLAAVDDDVRRALRHRR